MNTDFSDDTRIVPTQRVLKVCDNLKRYPADLQPWGSHASGVVVMPDGTVFISWYGGTCSGVNPETGAVKGDPLGACRVYIARLDPGADAFTEPTLIAGDGTVRYMDANLFIDHGKLHAYYVRDGANIDTVVRRTAENTQGTQWTEPQVVSVGTQARLMNPPLRHGSRVIAPLSAFDKSKQISPWLDAIMMILEDGKDRWRQAARIQHPDALVGLREPCVIAVGDELHMYFRVKVYSDFWTSADPTDPRNRVHRSVSRDNGETWSAPQPVNVTNLDSKVSVIVVDEGHLLMACNTEPGRWPLRLAISRDQGMTWTSAGIVDPGPGEMSYPTLYRTEDGTIHLSYTWQRRDIHYKTYNWSDIA